MNVGDADVAVEAVRAAGNAWAGIAVRHDGSFSYMAVGWRGGDGIYVYRNGGTPIAEPSAVVPVGGTLRVEVIGSSWSVFVNGTLAYSFSEAFNTTATRHGLRGGSDTAFDNFKVYSL